MSTSLKIANRQRPATVAAISAIVFATGTPSAAADVDLSKFNRSCNACHAAGVANAPKVGDEAAWTLRLDKGMDALVLSVKNGLGAMPPTGLCADCSDDEYKELITYMATAK